MRVIPNILFIDDDKFFLEFYRAELSQYNVRTEFAMDGQEGIDKAKSMKPDVILLDVILPKKDGFEVLEELKKDENTKDIPVIIISSLGNQADLDRLTKLGAVRIFNKLTYLPNDVAAYIQSLIGGEVSTIAVAEKKKDVYLSSEQVREIFSDSLKEVEGSFKKLFNKKTNLEDFDVALIPNETFKKYIDEMSKIPGTIFVYGKIDSDEPGMAILSMKRDDTLSLIRSIEEGIVGKELGLKMSDKAIEEFFNIIINSFLTKLAGSVSSKLILSPPAIASPSVIKKMIDSGELKKRDDQLVVFLQEAYTIEALDLSFSIFVTFGGDLMKK